MPRDPDTRSPVGHPARELSDMSSLVFPRQPQLVVLSVDGDMFHVSFGELLDRVVDRRSTDLGGSHFLGRVVGVETGTVPVAFLEGLGVEGRL